MKWPEEKNNLARRFRISFSSRKKKRNRSIEGAYRQDRRQSGSYGQGPDKRRSSFWPRRLYRFADKPGGAMLFAKLGR